MDINFDDYQLKRSFRLSQRNLIIYVCKISNDINLVGNVKCKTKKETIKISLKEFVLNMFKTFTSNKYPKR